MSILQQNILKMENCMDFFLLSFQVISALNVGPAQQHIWREEKLNLWKIAAANPLLCNLTCSSGYQVFWAFMKQILGLIVPRDFS